MSSLKYDFDQFYLTLRVRYETMFDCLQMRSRGDRTHAPTHESTLIERWRELYNRRLAAALCGLVIHPAESFAVLLLLFSDEDTRDDTRAARVPKAPRTQGKKETAAEWES